MKRLWLTVFILVLPVFIVVVVLILVLCSTGVRPLEAAEQEDGCWKELAGHLVDSLRPVVEVNESTESQNAHLPVVEAAKEGGGTVGLV